MNETSLSRRRYWAPIQLGTHPGNTRFLSHKENVPLAWCLKKENKIGVDMGTLFRPTYYCMEQVSGLLKACRH